MYLRFHGNYTSPKTKEPYGIFVVIYHLHRDGKLTEEDSALYLKTKDWFEKYLPNPPFYDDEDHNAIGAVTWFKANENTEMMIKQLDPFLAIAKKYDVEIIRTISEKVPGKVIYEDAYQIGVIR